MHFSFSLLLSFNGTKKCRVSGRKQKTFATYTERLLQRRMFSLEEWLVRFIKLDKNGLFLLYHISYETQPLIYMF